VDLGGGFRSAVRPPQNRTSGLGDDHDGVDHRENAKGKEETMRSFHHEDNVSLGGEKGGKRSSGQTVTSMAPVNGRKTVALHTESPGQRRKKKGLAKTP